MVLIPASRLRSLESAGTGSPDDIAYITAAARVADALTQDVLLAPIESSVIPVNGKQPITLQFNYNCFC